MNRSDYLFREGDLFATLDNARKKIIAMINDLSPSQLLPADDATVCEHFVKENTIEPIELHEEKIELIEPHEVDIQEADPYFGRTYTRKKLEFRFELPFTGDAILFRLRPSTFDFNAPRGKVTGNRVVFTILASENESNRVKQELAAWQSSLKQYIARQQPEVNGWNSGLSELVQQCVTARRQKLVADKQLVLDIGVPVRRRGDPSPAYIFPVTRKSVAPALPPAKGGALAKQEPSLDAAVYEEILDTLASMSVTMERCPSAFENLDEESLRMQFLIPLNSKFQGQTSGETFNASGKTDILIKHEDRIFFVAECKFWKGPKSLTETIDQLLGYMTWRETKAAILLFNRNRDFSAVLAQIPEVVKAHPQFVRVEQCERSTGCRFIVRHPNDAARHLTVTVLAFDVPHSVS
jgi:hypothetical protein